MPTHNVLDLSFREDFVYTQYIIHRMWSLLSTTPGRCLDPLQIVTILLSWEYIFIFVFRNHTQFRYSFLWLSAIQFKAHANLGHGHLLVWFYRLSRIFMTLCVPVEYRRIVHFHLAWRMLYSFDIDLICYLSRRAYISILSAAYSSYLSSFGISPFGFATTLQSCLSYTNDLPQIVEWIKNIDVLTRERPEWLITLPTVEGFPTKTSLIERGSQYGAPSWLLVSDILSLF